MRVQNSKRNSKSYDEEPEIMRRSSASMSAAEVQTYKRNSMSYDEEQEIMHRPSVQSRRNSKSYHEELEVRLRPSVSMSASLAQNKRNSYDEEPEFIRRPWASMSAVEVQNKQNSKSYTEEPEIIRGPSDSMSASEVSKRRDDASTPGGSSARPHDSSAVRDTWSSERVLSGSRSMRRSTSTSSRHVDEEPRGHPDEMLSGSFRGSMSGIQTRQRSSSRQDDPNFDGSQLLQGTPNRRSINTKNPSTSEEEETETWNAGRADFKKLSSGQRTLARERSASCRSSASQSPPGHPPSRKHSVDVMRQRDPRTPGGSYTRPDDSSATEDCGKRMRRSGSRSSRRSSDLQDVVEPHHGRPDEDRWLSGSLRASMSGSQPRMSRQDAPEPHGYPDEDRRLSGSIRASVSGSQQRLSRQDAPEPHGSIRASVSGSQQRLSRQDAPEPHGKPDEGRRLSGSFRAGVSGSQQRLSRQDAPEPHGSVRSSERGSLQSQMENLKLARKSLQESRARVPEGVPHDRRPSHNPVSDSEATEASDADDDGRGGEEFVRVQSPSGRGSAHNSSTSDLLPPARKSIVEDYEIVMDLENPAEVECITWKFNQDGAMVKDLDHNGLKSNWDVQKGDLLLTVCGTSVEGLQRKDIEKIWVEKQDECGRWFALSLLRARR